MSNFEQLEPESVVGNPHGEKTAVRKSLHDEHKHSLHDVDVERKTSCTEDVAKGDHTHYEKMDKEVAKYAGGEAIHISPEENIRLRKMIDKRVLVVMITTYFLQAIDKGTLSFAYAVKI